MKRWTEAIKRGPGSSEFQKSIPKGGITPGPRLGNRTITKKEKKNLRKKAKNLNISIVSTADSEVQIPNIFAWTKSYIPNKVHKTL